jgi:hypothetical protein
VGPGIFDVVLPTFVLVSRMQFTQQYRGNVVGGVLTRTSTVRVGLGVSGDTIVSGSCTRPSDSWIFSLVDLIFISLEIQKVLKVRY